jgi:hypothetical protein
LAVQEVRRIWKRYVLGMQTVVREYPVRYYVLIVEGGCCRISATDKACCSCRNLLNEVSTAEVEYSAGRIEYVNVIARKRGVFHLR